MKKYVNSACALIIAASMLATSINVYAAEEVLDTTEAVDEAVEAAISDEDDITIDEVVEANDSEEIAEDDIMTLMETSMILSEDEVSNPNTETLIDGEYTYYSACSMANFAGLGYSNNNAGPISIVKAKLTNSKGNESDVYVVGLSGTAFVKNQATGIVSDILAGFNLTNPYFDATVKAINETIPAGSKIILTGHSLGGMIAQEVSANPSTKKRYDIINVVTFGAPLINGLSREGDIKRLGDKHDLIPYLSVTGAILPVRSIWGLNREDGGYEHYTNFWSAHMGSYCRSDVWGSYDVLGKKNGSAKLTYDVRTVSYHLAPTIW